MFQLATFALLLGFLFKHRARGWFTSKSSPPLIFRPIAQRNPGVARGRTVPLQKKNWLMRRAFRREGR